MVNIRSMALLVLSASHIVIILVHVVAASRTDTKEAWPQHLLYRGDESPLIEGQKQTSPDGAFLKDVNGDGAVDIVITFEGTDSAVTFLSSTNVSSIADIQWTPVLAHSKKPGNTNCDAEFAFSHDMDDDGTDDVVIMFQKCKDVSSPDCACCAVCMHDKTRSV